MRRRHEFLDDFVIYSAPLPEGKPLSPPGELIAMRREMVRGDYPHTAQLIQESTKLTVSYLKKVQDEDGENRFLDNTQKRKQRK